MIPYFQQPALHVGPFTLHAFSLLVIAAILLARWVISFRARRLDVNQTAIAKLCVWMLIPGFIAAYLAKLILPNLVAFLSEPVSVMMRSGGVTSLAGLGGGLLGGVIWSRTRGISGFETLRMLDIIAYSLPFAWILGRLGCFLAHDHRGLYTQSWIGVRFPEGTRYDLGLMELLFLIPFAALFSLLGRRARPAGYFFGMYGAVYGLYRVWQDTLHIQPLSYLNGMHGDMFGGTITCLVGLAGWAMMKRYARNSGGPSSTARAEACAISESLASPQSTMSLSFTLNDAALKQPNPGT